MDARKGSLIITLALSLSMLALAQLACQSGEQLLSQSTPDTATLFTPAAPTPTLEGEQVLKHYVLSINANIQLQPGEEYQFVVGDVKCCVYFSPLDVPAVWSVSPAQGASIAQNGLFKVDENTPNGSVFTVTADINGGEAQAEIEVYVYKAEDNPLAGMWVEEAQLACDSGELLKPSQLIGELNFKADGSFTVTWVPFEVYVDYIGKYKYDLPSGDLELTIEDGNYIPSDFKPAGSFVIDEEGRLVLKDVWLGTLPDSGDKVQCGHLFRRVSP